MLTRSWYATARWLATRLHDALGAICLLAMSSALAAAQDQQPPNLLRDLSASLETLSAEVSPSVVQVEATGYEVEGSDRERTGLVVKPQQSIGSGVIVDADGYIVTNAHVLGGAQRATVVLPHVSDNGGSATVYSGPRESLPAQVVGTAPDIDLALLKVEATGLKALPIPAHDGVHQGELVFAFGSPEGLPNSVTMGIVSAVARQPNLDSPSVYIQTDAPINPGNSGGPLVNVKGELVGLNTFILSDSGGSEGLGFAIPSAVVSAAYLQLRAYGRMHRGYIGIQVQGITSSLATGLGLARTTGVIVADVSAGGPADLAGVQIGDIVLTVNGHAIDSVPTLALEVETQGPGETVTLDVLRETTRLSLTTQVIEQPPDGSVLVDLADIDSHSIKRLGIVVTDITPTVASTLRIPFGVLVAARDERSLDRAVPLMSGDVIHAVNGLRIRSIVGLRALLDGVKADAEVVLQIERGGQLKFVTARIF